MVSEIKPHARAAHRGAGFWRRDLRPTHEGKKDGGQFYFDSIDMWSWHWTAEVFDGT